MKKHRLIAKALSVLLAGTLVLSACSPGGEEDDKTTTASTTTTTTTTKESEKPTEESEAPSEDETDAPTEEPDDSEDATEPSSEATDGTEEPTEEPSDETEPTDDGGEEIPNEAENYVPEEPVTLTYYGWENELNFAILAEAFNERHENITIERETVDLGGDDELTKMAAAGQLPDIISFWNVGTAVKNGWVADITEYFENDPLAEQSSYMNVVNATKINDRLFALPAALFINGLMVNTDLLAANNIDVPEYTWTYSDHEEILKKATVQGESRGNVDVRWSFDFYPATYANDPVGRLWFNQETRRFELGESFEVIVNHFQELLDANVSIWEHADKLGMPWLLDEGDPERERQEEARQQFLIDAIGAADDGWAIGKTASHAWDGAGMGWTIRDQRYDGFTYDLYPYPMNDDHPYDHPHIGVFPDLAGVTTSSKDPEAAYEYLRYISYETQGYLDRVEKLAAYDKDEYVEHYKISPEFADTLPEEPELLYGLGGVQMNTIPPANTPQARDAWRAFHPIGSPDGTPGYHYLIDFVADAYVDAGRTMPGYGEAAGYIIDNIWDQVINGDMAPGDIAQEVEDQANRILEGAMEEIEMAMNAD